MSDRLYLSDFNIGPAGREDREIFDINPESVLVIAAHRDSRVLGLSMLEAMNLRSRLSEWVEKLRDQPLT